MSGSMNCDDEYGWVSCVLWGVNTDQREPIPISERVHFAVPSEVVRSGGKLMRFQTSSKTFELGELNRTGTDEAHLEVMEAADNCLGTELSWGLPGGDPDLGRSFCGLSPMLSWAYG